MKINYIAQPNLQLGRIVFGLLDAKPKKIVFVSAFAGLQTIMRIKSQVLDLVKNGSEFRFVLGIDLGGTSQEVLRELLSWKIDIYIVKHRIPKHTFHPKLYLFEWDNRAEIIIGSNNLTEGGFFGNYEGCARIVYDLPEDSKGYLQAFSELERFIKPNGPVVYTLNEDLIKKLIAGNDLPSEAEARRHRDIGAARKSKSKTSEENIFGMEDIDPPPPLPTELLERLVVNLRERQKKIKAEKPTAEKKKPAKKVPISKEIEDVLFPASFYMTLPTLQGETIPGEARIPLEAIELAKEFWGWPEEYTEEVSPRGGQQRIYWNWRPKWLIWSVEAPKEAVAQTVRMYMYTNSSDFRFYVRPLVNAGGDLGDVVRIRRISRSDAEYECVLARKGTKEYEEWIKFCTQVVRGKKRRFGYA